MNSKLNKLTGAAVLAAALATAGCSADMFNQANAALKSVQTAGKAVGNVRIPTAAIAASLGGLELVKALSSDGAQKKSSIIAAGGGNLVAAGSGNIIAAGGLNFNLLQADVAADLNKQVVKNLDANGVKAELKYTSRLEANSLVSSIDSFVGTTNGYNIDLSGAEFTYNVSSGGNGGSVSFRLAKAASLVKPADKSISGSKEFKAVIGSLLFETSDPMPDNSAYIGGFKLTADDSGAVVTMEADLTIKNKKVVVAGKVTSTVNGKDEVKEIRFDQDNPGFSSEDRTDAEKALDKKEADERAAAKAQAQKHRDCRTLLRDGKPLTTDCETILGVKPAASAGASAEAATN